MRKGTWFYFISALLTMCAAPAAQADWLKAELHGYNEVPTLSTPATGQFRARINRDETEIQYELSYAGFTTPVLVAHLHLGKRAVTGEWRYSSARITARGPPARRRARSWKVR
jgi:hypothetical protein